MNNMLISNNNFYVIRLPKKGAQVRGILKNKNLLWIIS